MFCARWAESRESGRRESGWGWSGEAGGTVPSCVSATTDGPVAEGGGAELAICAGRGAGGRVSSRPRSSEAATRYGEATARRLAARHPKGAVSAVRRSVLDRAGTVTSGTSHFVNRSRENCTGSRERFATEGAGAEVRARRRRGGRGNGVGRGWPEGGFPLILHGFWGIRRGRAEWYNKGVAEVRKLFDFGGFASPKSVRRTNPFVSVLGAEAPPLSAGLKKQANTGSWFADANSG